MAELLKVHLARPAGEREGPFSVEEINRELAKGRYRLSDYWAWHEGLPEWVPLYAIEGISKVPLADASDRGPEESVNGSVTKEAVSEFSVAGNGQERAGACLDEAQACRVVPDASSLGLTTVVAQTDTAVDLVTSEAPATEAASRGGAVTMLEPSTDEIELKSALTGDEEVPDIAAALTRPECKSELRLDPQDAALGETNRSSSTAEESPPHPEKVLLTKRFYSGMPFEALEQLFIFTTGDGPSVWESPRIARMLEAITGAPLGQIRKHTPRDVIFNCNGSQLLKFNGAISHEAWRAMAIREPMVIERAQAKFCRTCVCSFPTEENAIVALVLFYRVEPEPSDTSKAPS